MGLDTMERINIDDHNNIERVKSTGKITTEGDHIVVGKDKTLGTIYYRNRNTGNLEYIGSNGEWVEA